MLGKGHLIFLDFCSSFLKFLKTKIAKYNNKIESLANIKIDVSPCVSISITIMVMVYVSVYILTVCKCKRSLKRYLNRIASLEQWVRHSRRILPSFWRFQFHRCDSTATDVYSPLKCIRYICVEQARYPFSKLCIDPFFPLSLHVLKGGCYRQRQHVNLFIIKMTLAVNGTPATTHNSEFRNSATVKLTVRLTGLSIVSHILSIILMAISGRFPALWVINWRVGFGCEKGRIRMR